MLLKHLMGKEDDSASREKEHILHENELAELQYLADHVVHKTLADSMLGEHLLSTASLTDL